MEDEPLDDLRAAGMTVGATAARVVEIVARDLQAKAQQRQDEQRRQGEAAVRGVRWDTRGLEVPPRDEPAFEQRDQDRVELEQAERWANPERRASYDMELLGSDSVEGNQQARRRLVDDWKSATSTTDEVEPATYDAGRTERDSTMRAAGVPDDARQARTTADLLNGTDPAGAAKSGSKTRAKKAAPVAAREPSRGR